MKKLPEEVRKEAVRLRMEERLSLKDIRRRLGRVSQSTLSNWLKSFPLSSDEIRERYNLEGLMRGRCPRIQGDESRLHLLLKGRTPSRVDNARIAEAAVLLRVLVMGWDVYGSVFDGSKFDWVVSVEGRLIRVQVKSAQHSRTGSPFIRLCCANGRGKLRRYSHGEFDFIVAYDLLTDTSYVWSWGELVGQTAVSVCHEAAERWDKFLGR